MPLFFMHLCNGDGFVEDETGTEHQDLAAARGNAVRSLRDVTADEARGGKIFAASFIEIEDDVHRHVATVSFADAVQISHKIERLPRPLEPS